jgi:hypothetical protein
MLRNKEGAFRLLRALRMHIEEEKGHQTPETVEPRQWYQHRHLPMLGPQTRKHFEP